MSVWPIDLSDLGYSSGETLKEAQSSAYVASGCFDDGAAAAAAVSSVDR